MNDMHDLLSGSFPAPEDEPPQRDVIGPAMAWGERRRRLEWSLAGVAAAAVVAVGAGIAALSGGSGSGTAGIGPAATGPGVISSSDGAPSTWQCTGPGDYCKLLDQVRAFPVDFADGSLTSLQAALPTGFHLTQSGKQWLVLTGPGGKTNLLFPSVTSADTQQQPGCNGAPGCVQASYGGGTTVVDGQPSGGFSAGWDSAGKNGTRITILLSSVDYSGKPLSPAMLTESDLQALVQNPGFQTYAKDQWVKESEVIQQMQVLSPSSSGPGTLPSGAIGGSSPGNKVSSSWETIPASGGATLTSLPVNTASTSH